MGNIWEFMAIYGHLWPFMAISHIVMAIYRETYGKHMGNIWENDDFFERFN
jgi:3-hydroxymyristoyl/3-hydroxydecanoyl-(acyl carrier protein) dehydratase